MNVGKFTVFNKSHHSLSLSLHIFIEMLFFWLLFLQADSFFKHDIYIFISMYIYVRSNASIYGLFRIRLLGSILNLWANLKTTNFTDEDEQVLSLSLFIYII